MTTFKIGGPADLLVHARTPEQLIQAVHEARRLGVPYFGRRTTHEDDDSGFWAGAAHAVMARPWISMIGSAGFLVLLTLPFFTIQLGFSGPTAIPESFQARN